MLPSMGAVLVLLAVGCGAKQKPAAAQKAVTGISDKKAQPEEKKKDEEEADKTKKVKYVYNPQGKPDPFQPFIASGPEVEGREPLEKYDLAQLRLTGIIWGMNSMAMVEDPEGRGYVVKVGTSMGKNMGKVIEIQPTKLVILEQYVDPVRGSVIRNTVYLELPKGEGEL
jgi:type IV pilus assembly protein PilP